MNESSSQRPKRRSLRYQGYDYTSPGAYFITICAAHGRSYFGEIVAANVLLQPVGQLAESCWLETPIHYPHVRLDTHVIMPNHLHLLFWLQDGIFGEQELSVHQSKQRSPDPAQRNFGESIPGSVSTIIATYKAAVTRVARQQGLHCNESLWHKRFWDHIVRGPDELQRIRDYIHANPARWAADQLHPDAPSNRWNQWHSP